MKRRRDPRRFQVLDERQRALTRDRAPTKATDGHVSATADRELATVLATYMRVGDVLVRYVRVDGRWLRDDRLVT